MFVLAAASWMAACAPAAAPTNAPASQPTEATMAMPTDAMMKVTDAAMMAKPTDAMVKATDAAMMAKPTDAAMTSGSSDAMMPKFPQQQFAAHFVDSMPMHEAIVTELPKNVLLNFNFTLSDASTITIEKDGKELKTVPGKLDGKKLAMSTEIPGDMGAGMYLVKYKACWPDNSCHNGQFAFFVK